MGLKYRIEDSVFIPYLTLMGLKYRIEDSVFIPYLRINFKELKFNINGVEISNRRFGIYTNSYSFCFRHKHNAVRLRNKDHILNNVIIMFVMLKK